MPPPNSQVGAQLRVDTPPTFTGYVVVGGTWRPTNLLQNSVALNEDRKPFNFTFYAPGTRVECEMYQKVAGSPADLEPSLVITDGDGTLWVVLRADPIEFGSVQTKFAVTLELHEDLDATQTTAGT